MIMFEVTCRCGTVGYEFPSSVRDKVFRVTMDPEISIDVENWCELATVGEVYTGREFTVEVVLAD